MNTFQRIQYLATNKGMSIAELERKLNLSNGSIARWKKSAPSSRGLTIIADYFDVSVDYLLGREKDEYTGENKSEDILIMHRATENMTEAQRQKALTILETMFDDWDDLTK
ncbi:helix-turn-helix domain-containing protein [Staphylococcus epidermidis]|nr:helix-turn-helix domain-containing protein [Staphylococcus epidermidis]MCG2293769.1 helix-turn-helix domain-containing protein [Staphylococcus epidermidis]MCG2394162.1 helix-turn-helix domain-containing protein [Staphylococcus epidermidis]MCG2403885.1 helix-turn-helix domain-containing protein [Staphylococcus epidermidis]